MNWYPGQNVRKQVGIVRRLCLKRSKVNAAVECASNKDAGRHLKNTSRTARFTSEPAGLGSWVGKINRCCPVDVLLHTLCIYPLNLQMQMWTKTRFGFSLQCRRRVRAANARSWMKCRTASCNLTWLGGWAQGWGHRSWMCKSDGWWWLNNGFSGYSSDDKWWLMMNNNGWCSWAIMQSILNASH